MGRMRLFRHTVTGSVGEYPDHYADLFPHFEPVEQAEPCLDCIPDVTDIPVADVDHPIGFLLDGEEEETDYERR